MGLKRSVFVGVFGATTGLTVMEFSSNGAKPIHHAEIPWVGNAKVGLYWPAEWVASELDRLRDLAGKGDVLALAMPGADLVVGSPEDLSSPCPSVPLQHYRGVMEGGFIERATAVASPAEIYRRTGGAHVAAFQPYAQLLALQSRHPGLLDERAEIVPLNDWMTWRLSGRRGHDPAMLQDQGLAHDGRKVCEEIVRMPRLADRIAPWPVFGEAEALEIDNGAFVVPVTHDSVPARTAGYSACPWVIWTGTWIGTACRVAKIDPSEAALDAGIAFEGFGGSLSAITNVGMLGRTYKTLVQCADLTFEEASVRAIGILDRREPERFSIADLPLDEEDAAAHLVDLYGERVEEILAGVVHTTAAACAEKITATADLLGMPRPDEVAIIGGWARNVAFRVALGRSFREVRIPSQAADATAVGLAAHALVAVGDAKDVKEALDLLPPLEEC